MLRRLFAIPATAAGVAVLLAAGSAAPAAARPSSPPPSICSGVLRVNSFAFDPPSVFAGKSSAAALTATNCTGQSQAVAETWTGRFSSDSSSGTGIPPGCPVLDPYPRPVTFGPHERVTTSTTYTTFAGCTATRLTVTVTITQGGTQLARRSADLVIM
ncbi:hypothetical protein [Streptomyces sp. NBC_01198]|uniref:hypothetical protein n=1 Tax=Streptomyces sp. NBC_01198 TaxID=2903769 RepID=UPI002E1041D1|nr:hypothetical protein OG702_00550 [Streptomyces sp. NBC_01198]